MAVPGSGPSCHVGAAATGPGSGACVGPGRAPASWALERGRAGAFLSATRRCLSLLGIYGPQRESP